MRGRRDYMEDRVDIQLNKKNGFSYFGVYDGHGGDVVSDFLKKHLSPKIFDLTENPDTIGDKINDVVSSIDVDINQTYPIDRTTGSTCVGALLNETPTDGHYPLKIFNIGDSRAMIIEKNGNLRINTLDHKPNDQNERERVEKAGGHVYWGRVDSMLAVSRAFGDWTFKNNSDLSWKEQKVTVLPDIYQTTLKPGELLVLTSDGLFENTTDAAICHFIHQALEEKQAINLNEIADRLLKWAHGVNYSKDNLSVILVLIPESV